MTRVAYTVTASFPDRSIADEFVEWLRGGHVRAVMAGGATSATIVRLDPDSPGAGATGGTGGLGGAASAPIARHRVEVRYEFPSRADFQRYTDVHAPALRSEGLAKFGPRRAVEFSRTLGDIV